MRGPDHEASVNISLSDAYHGASRTVALQGQEMDGQGRIRPFTRNLQVKIPPGVTDGTRIRLAGKGGAGMGGGPPGDLYLMVHIEPDPRFRIRRYDLELDVPVSAWEAALGTSLDLSLVDGSVTLKIPPGTQTGQRLRLRGKGLPSKKNGRGDLYVVIRIMVPTELGPKEKELFSEMARVSNFNPRETPARTEP